MGLWPVYFVLITIISLEYRKYSACCVHVLNDERNLGTILFDKSFLNKQCWTNEEFVILRSRKVFQDLIPKTESSNIWNDQYIVDLYKYIHICFEYVYNLSVGTTKHLLLKALADVMGGYLYSYVIPITKLSFYAGNVQYCNVKKILELLLEIKSFLNTNGEGWKKTITTKMQMKNFINATPIILRLSNDSTACNKLIIDSARPHKRSTYKRWRCRVNRKRFVSRRNVKEDSNGTVNRTQKVSLRMFLPYLDNNIRPNSIALPFKDHNLWSLYEEESISVLSTYYETCVNCISSTNNYERILAHFNKDFYNWLQQSVYPRLSDDKLYPAFGGVLRILAYLKKTVKNQGKKSVIKINPTTNSRLEEIAVTTPKVTEDVEASSSLSTMELIIIAVSSAALVWILVGLILICYRYLRKHSDECSPCGSPNSDVAALYKNTDFCDLNTCPSMSQKSTGEKVTKWWRTKFKTHLGECNKIGKNEQYFASINCGSKKSLCSQYGRRPHKRRKKKIKSESVSISPTNSPCDSYINKNFHYSSEMSSSNSDSSYR